MAARKVIREENTFSALNRVEQQLLVPKLLGIHQRVGFTADEYERAVEKFQVLIQIENQSITPEDKFLTLHNFLRQLSVLPDAWVQVRQFLGIARSYLELTVYDHREFLLALKAEGYAVNSWMEKVSRWAGHGHRFDSARARTEHRYDPQLHLVNDRADEATYGPNYFFAHWDAQSVYAKKSGLFSRIAAGRTHKDQTASPQEVNVYLDQINAVR